MSFSRNKIEFKEYTGFQALTQPVFTCSKLVIETLEQGVKYVQSSHLVIVFLLLTLNM